MKLLYTLLFITCWICSSAQKQGHTQNSEWAKKQTYVIMVSIDGFRHDYADKYGASNILQIKETGIWTKALVPSFPSKTFPNHYTLATGLRPGNHGLVGNSFYSREKQDKYKIRDREKVEDGSWYGGIPLWVLAQQQGMNTACYFWVGSEADVKGVRPFIWKKYDGSVPNEKRIETAFEWLKMPEESRPHLVFLYFSLVDDAGHDFGPESKEVEKTVTEVDQLIGQIRSGVEQSGLDIHLIVTSDHGMTSISSGINLSSIDFEDAQLDFSSTMVMVYHQDEQVIRRIKKRLEAVNRIKTFTDEEIGQELGFRNTDRVGDLVILCDPPVIFSKSKKVTGGTHGYDPARFPDMNAIFYAEGSSIKSGTEIGTFDNVDVFPFVARILNLDLKEVTIDGDLDELKAAFK